MGEINKTVTIAITANKTLDIKWISATTEPSPPEGYTRLPDLDMSLPIDVMGIQFTVTLWAFQKV